MIVATVPKQGQLVHVRNRQYVVVSVDQSLSDAPLEHQRHQQHLITLNSIEDDALGEMLKIIWELEPGAAIIEQNALPSPDQFDSPERFDAFMHAVRWGIVSPEDTNILQAPFRSGIELKDYQLDPLVRALSLPRVNLLIADDVGLGKTIETGMVVQEMIIRARARSVLIVCPAGLQLHWHDQMRDKFGLEFRIIDSAAMKALRRSRGIDVNPWAHFPRLITSIDFLKRARPMRLMRELLPAEGEIAYPRPFDLLIVDEAHNIAPSGSGHYAVESQRTQAIRTLAPHFEHKLFLSATPHNGYKESFTALLELLDNQRFARGIDPNRNQLKQVMVRRLKSDLTDALDVPLFKSRKLASIEVAYSAAERKVHQMLKRYGELRQAHARDNSERYATEFVLKLLKKRLFSSPAAFAVTLAQHRATLEGKGAIDQKRSRRKVSLNILRQQLTSAETEYEDDADYDEATNAATNAASSNMTQLSAREIDLLNQMQTWAEAARIDGDSKLTALFDWLQPIVKPNGAWSDERVIIFTEYRTTQNWLRESLIFEGLDRVAEIYDGMPPDKREAVKAAFQTAPQHSPVRILLATDAASEGIDLQNYCHRLVHIEIPWNPNRLEQRNGRIDRHGQQYHPHIFHFVPHGYASRVSIETPSDSTESPDLVESPDALEADLEFLWVAVQKIGRIREDLGSVGSVITAQVEEKMLGRRTTLDTAHAERKAQRSKALLKFEQKLRDDIARYHQRVEQTRTALQIAPENVKLLVDTALALDHQQPLAPHESDPATFWLPPLTGSWMGCGQGLAHPHTGDIRPITFTPSRAERRDDVVYAHLNHALVQRSIRLLRAEVWAPATSRSINRITARRIPSHVAERPIVVAFARLVITGGDQHRLHEEIIVAGGELTVGSNRPFRRIRAQYRLNDAVLQMSDDPASPAQQAVIRDLWPKIETPLLESLKRRRDTRLKDYEEQLLERAQRQADAIESVLRELERTISAELTIATQPQQLEIRFEGWNTQERDQLRRDIGALQRRLAAIPDEIEREKELIYNRVLSPTPRMFPLSVLVLIPS